MSTRKRPAPQKLPQRKFSRADAKVFALGAICYFAASRLSVFLEMSREYGTAENVGQAVFAIMALQLAVGILHFLSGSTPNPNKPENKSGALWVGFFVSFLVDGWLLIPLLQSR